MCIGKENIVHQREGKKHSRVYNTHTHHDDSGTKQAMFVIEVTQLHALYEKMILSVAKFPRANQVNQPILDYADLVWEIVETPSVATWSVNDLRGFTEVNWGGDDELGGDD